jgi:hypothetical protein
MQNMLEGEVDQEMLTLRTGVAYPFSEIDGPWTIINDWLEEDNLGTLRRLRALCDDSKTQIGSDTDHFRLQLSGMLDDEGDVKPVVRDIVLSAMPSSSYRSRLRIDIEQDPFDDINYQRWLKHKDPTMWEQFYGGE